MKITVAVLEPPVIEQRLAHRGPQAKGPAAGSSAWTVAASGLPAINSSPFESPGALGRENGLRPWLSGPGQSGLNVKVDTKKSL